MGTCPVVKVTSWLCPAGPHQPHTVFLITVIPSTLAEPATLHLFSKAEVSDIVPSRARNQTLLSHSMILEWEKRIAPPQQNWCKCQLWFQNSPFIGKLSFSLMSSSWVPKGSQIVIYKNNTIIFEVWQCLLSSMFSYEAGVDSQRSIFPLFHKILKFLPLCTKCTIILLKHQIITLTA